MRAFLRRLLFQRGWDTLCRHRAPIRAVRAALAEEAGSERRPLLDVGSGGAGLAAFLPDIQVVGVDIDQPARIVPNLEFRTGSILELPFADREFEVVSCIDVIENLAPDDRPAAIAELVRVARRGVVVACPQGRVAAECDADFRRALAARDREAPGWLAEHEAYRYPEVDEVVDAVRSADPSARVSASFSESAAVCRTVRRAAARSDVLYAAVNLLFGLLLPLMPRPGRESGYRMVVVAERG
jgi:SAM-dependent methyltransferase